MDSGSSWQGADETLSLGGVAVEVKHGGGGLCRRCGLRAAHAGHGPLTTLEQAQRDTRDLLVALRQHMLAAVSEMTDMDSAVKSFDGSAFMRLEHSETWLPQLANRTYLDVERE